MEPGCDWMDGRVDLGGLWKGGWMDGGMGAGWMVLRYLDGKFIGWSVFKHLVIKIISILIIQTYSQPMLHLPYIFYQSGPKICVYLQPMVDPAVIGTKA